MTHLDQIESLLKLNHGVITARQAKENHIDAWYLSDLVKKEKLTKLSRGIYTNANGDYDQYYFFQVAHTRCIYSFQCALYLHQLTDRLPTELEVTVYNGYNISKIKNQAKVHVIEKKYYEIGIAPIQTTFGNMVLSYNMERTICDLIRFRKWIDTEIFVNAVRSYFSHPGRDYTLLRKYAKTFKIDEEVNNIMEIIAN